MPLPRPSAPAAEKVSAPTEPLDEKAIEKLLNDAADLLPEFETILKEERTAVDEIAVSAQKAKADLLAQRRELIKRIPEFWLTAFRNHSVLKSTLSPFDEQIFTHLDDIDISDDGSSTSKTTITFTFKPNPFLAGTKLWKTFTPVFDLDTLPPDTTLCEEEDQYFQVSQSRIEWGSKRPSEEELANSFFMFFQEMDAVHLTVMKLIKEELWANPLGFYLGEIKSDFPEDDELDDEFEGQDGDEEGEGLEGGDGDDGEGQ